MGRTTVAKWRRALGVTRTNNEGSQVLIHAATAKALGAAREQGVSEEERRRRSRLILEVRPWEASPDVTYGTAWEPGHVALLGAAPDREVARRTGHTLNAVRTRRRAMGIGPFRSRQPGVYLERRTGRYCSRICIRGRHVALGTFATFEEARDAYEAANLGRGHSPGIQRPGPVSRPTGAP